MTITYQSESPVQARPDIEALAAEQWAEMAKGGFEAFVQNPNYEFYLNLAARNMLILLTAREDGILVGYLAAYVYGSTTSQGEIMVQAGPYYAVQSLGCLRRGLVLRGLFRKLVEIGSQRGSMVTIKTHPWATAAPLLRHMGFREAETWYTLRVGSTETRAHA